MRALIQRVARCTVRVEGREVGSIGAGMLILLGVRRDDTEQDASFLARKCARLRIFSDSEWKMNISLRDTGGSALVVSQFTLYGDTKRGLRPSYTDAAPPVDAERLYTSFIIMLQSELGMDRVAAGIFRAAMEVELLNDGPVTLLIESTPDSSGQV